MTSEDAQRIADGLFAIASALHRLGTGNAATEMGAIEMLAKEVKEGIEDLVSAVGELTLPRDD